MIAKRLCRHCNIRGANRPRGLCWYCYYKVRHLYPSVSKYRAKHGDIMGGLGLPESATDAMPGSERKILILRERETKQTSLWHPFDLTLSDLCKGDDL